MIQPRTQGVTSLFLGTRTLGAYPSPYDETCPYGPYGTPKFREGWSRTGQGEEGAFMRWMGAATPVADPHGPRRAASWPRDKGAIHHPRAQMVPFPAGGCASSQHKTEMRWGQRLPSHRSTGPGPRTGISIPAPERARSLVSRKANNTTERVKPEKKWFRSTGYGQPNAKAKR